MTAALAEAVPFVQAACRRRLAGLHHPLLDPQDVAQEALISLLRRAEREPVPTTEAYMTTVARNHAVDACRLAGRDLRRRGATVDDLAEQLTAHDPGPAELAEQADLRRRLRGLLAHLNDRERLVIFLRVWVGLTSDETAAEIGATAGTVRVVQHRALGKLRARLIGGAR